MLIGEISTFAIESEITRAVENQSQMALGYFVIHILGTRFGVKKPDATMLGCSFNEVAKRLKRRGCHSFPALLDADAHDIATTFRVAIYGEPDAAELFFGMPAKQFRIATGQQNLQWAPDGDEAFDDGSYVLQIETETQVRLIAFNTDFSAPHQPYNVRDLRLPAEEFYAVLRKWHDSFWEEWVSKRARLLLE